MKNYEQQLKVIGNIIYFFVFPICICFLWTSFVLANNVTVSNVEITGQSTQNTAKVQFDITWENSWRNINNSGTASTSDPNDFRDAVWVFIKYSSDSGVTWKHGLLKTSVSTTATNPTGFSQGSGTGLNIIVPSDKVGAFMERSARGSGQVNTQDIELLWDWGATGSGLAKESNVQVKVFAIEMVYIPGGAFFVGSGSNKEMATLYTGAVTTPYTVNSEDAILVNSSNLYYAAAGTTYGSANAGDRSGPVKAPFPKGYNAFYAMKYEISQGGYRDFLNTLTSAQQAARVENSSESGYAMKNQGTPPSRNSLRKVSGKYICDLNQNGVGGDSNDGDWVAMNYLNWTDLAAYADWAGLRPMTELEFEKVARGTKDPVGQEFVWGSNKIKAVGSMVNSGKVNETAVELGEDGLANYNNSSLGPVRLGFAGSSAASKVSTTRIQSGSSYYGVKDLSGNVWEQTVSIGSSVGRDFLGNHGDGNLSDNGNADIQYWPGYTVSVVAPSGFEVTQTTGSGLRGGSFKSVVNVNGTSDLNTSDRNNAAYNASGRQEDIGGRCARSVLP